MRFAIVLAGLSLALCPVSAQTTGEVRGGEIRGSVADARGGEALANVQVHLAGTTYRTVSDAAGRFQLQSLPAGDYTLNVSTVGYHLVQRTFHLDAGESKDFDVVLSPDTFHQTETVVAKADPFEAARPDAPSTLLLAGNDAKNLASVLADDPLRAVQSLPGVSANNDFDARFSVRGADYNRVGLFLDGVLLHQPFHMLEGTSITGSGTAFNGDLVEQMELFEGAYPQRFGDRSGSILDITTRDGNRQNITFRVEASASNASALAEGPLGKKKRGTWLVSARKSYLQYILQRTFPDTSLIFGLQDVQGRLSYDFSPKNTVTFFFLESMSNLDRSSSKSKLGVNSLMEASYHYSLGNLSWRYAPDAKVLIANHVAWMREKFDDSNPSDRSLGAGIYGEWVWNGSLQWMWNSRTPLEAGWTVRRLKDQGYQNQYSSTTVTPRLVDHFDGNDTIAGGHLQQSWLAWSGRLRLNASVRWDHDSISGLTATSPQFSTWWRVGPSTHLELGWGQYVQFQEIPVLTSPLGSRGLLPLRSNQAIAALEQRFGERTRLRIETYDRVDRDMVFQPTYDPRLLAPSLKVFAPAANPPYVGSLRGYSRGVEAFLQRSSANRFTGWVSYAFGRTSDRDGVTGNRFPSPQDQRHTVNIYGGYRMRPTVNLSLRWTWGSNFPIPGYLTKVGANYYLTTVRNQLRLPSYSRTDFRINKSWIRGRYHLTLYGEVINLTNRTNYLFDSFNGYNATTHLASLTLDKMFPILPSAGIVFER